MTVSSALAVSSSAGILGDIHIRVTKRASLDHAKTPVFKVTPNGGNQLSVIITYYLPGILVLTLCSEMHKMKVMSLSLAGVLSCKRRNRGQN